MEILKRSWIVLRRRWIVVALWLVAVVVGVSLYNVTAHKEYIASTELFLRAPDVKTSASAYQGDLFSRQRVLTYSKMFESDDLAQRVIDRLGLALTPSQLVSQVSASTVKDTVLMVVSVTDPSPTRAANIANAYGDVLNGYVAKIEFVDNNPDIPPLVQVVTKADPATAISTALPLWQIIVAAFAVAVAGSVATIWFLERYDTRVRSRRALEAITGSTVIGRFVRNKKLVGVSDVGSAFADDEEFRQAALRLSANVDAVLRSMPELSKPPLLAVVAAHPGAGATLVSATLGHAFAERGRSVVEMRFGPEAKALERPKDGVPGVTVTTVELRTLLTAEAFDYRLDAAKEGADIVILDCPAFAESVEAQVLIGAADVVLEVIDAGVPKRSLTTLVDGVAVIGTPVLGAVVNFARGSATADGANL